MKHLFNLKPFSNLLTVPLIFESLPDCCFSDASFNISQCSNASIALPSERLPPLSLGFSIRSNRHETSFQPQTLASSSCVSLMFDSLLPQYFVASIAPRSCRTLSFHNVLVEARNVS